MYQATKFSKLVLTTAMTALLATTLVACDNGKASTSTESTTAKTPTNITKTANTPAISQPHPSADSTQLMQALNQNMAKSGIDAKIISVSPTEMPSMFMVKVEGMRPFLSDSTGQYVVQGEIIKIGLPEPVSITRDLMANEAKTALAKIDKKDMIIFPAKGVTKSHIYVFTDADCGYCRKLHSQINDINALGIEVRYLPWPRSEESFPIMEKVWCSKDRANALTKAKNGEPITAPQCQNPVAKIHDLGLSLGVSGTPAIFTPEGHQIGGYLPPEEIVKALKIH